MSDWEKYRREPWSWEGRNILDSTGDPVATTADPEDARRIVAAVNAVQGMPTEALESWTVEIISDPTLELDADSDFEGPEAYPNDRRARQDRRRADRREGGLNTPSPWEVRSPGGMASSR